MTRQLKSPNRNQPVLPVWGLQAGIADAFAGGGGVDETFVAGIDADVGDLFRRDGEEDQVARLQITGVDQLAGSEEILRSARQL